MKKIILIFIFLLAGAGAVFAAAPASRLSVRENGSEQSLSVFRVGEDKPILTQNAWVDSRPSIHLLATERTAVTTSRMASDETNSLFWAFGKLNDRDYSSHSGADYWRRVSSRIVTGEGDQVAWQTVYQLLDQTGQPILEETQDWSMRGSGEAASLDLSWTGKALVDVVVARSPYDGLSLTLHGVPTSGFVNSQRQADARAGGQSAAWLDIGLKPEGSARPLRITMFDNPKNAGFPQPWRIDPKRGIGPSPALTADWKIAKGEQTSFLHRVSIYSGDFNSIALNDAWKSYSGENDGRAWIRSRQEARLAKFLTGEQSVAKMTTEPGLEVKLFASEPTITQPIAFCWDDRGRLWVAENRDFETRGTGFANSGDSRIVILEDTDGDGVMDTKKVFIEGIPFPSALAWGFDGLWLGAVPNLLFIPDRNHDDKPDSTPIVKLTGWGIRDRHEVLNSLTWGPDGWLYGAQGFATTSTVGKPADGVGYIPKKGEAFPENIKVKDGQFIDGGVWRYHPTKEIFEIVATGFSNPWGLDFDDHGQMFITACVIPHLWHVILGGYYMRQGGAHRNPYVYSDIPTIADHRHLSAHGGARIYLADAFPEKYRDRIFMANLHEHALLTDILEPKGSGFIGHHGDDTLLANDPQWVGFSVEVGPEGAVYILDWHDADICGNDVLNKDTGRLYRLAPVGLKGKTGLDLAALDDAALVELQSNTNDWYVRRSRLLLQQRAAEGKLGAHTHELLWKLFRAQADTGRKLRALWALHVTGGLPHERLVELLDHEAAYVRAWAIQLLGEDSKPGEDALRKFTLLAEKDSSPVVRLYLTSVLQRVAPNQRWSIVEALIRHREDEMDHNLPKMLWFAAEPLVMQDPARALSLVGPDALLHVSRLIARRAAQGGQLGAVVDALLISKDSGVQQVLLEGMRDGLQGIAGINVPDSWTRAQLGLATSANIKIKEIVLQIGQLLGDAKAVTAQLNVMLDPAVPPDRRRRILEDFAQKGTVPVVPSVLKLLNDTTLRRDAIRALSAFADPSISPEILGRYASWSPQEKAEAILTLSSRRLSAMMLFASLRNQTIPRTDISAYNVRQLRRVIGPGFGDFWGAGTELPAEKQQEAATYRALLTDASLAKASPNKGRLVFERTCAVCHTLYGTGGKIGPDLTGSNRADLNYILNEILNPSDVVQENYQLVTIATRDGRTLAGNVASEDDQKVILRLIGQDTVVPKSEIISREKSLVSMMPEGLLKTLSESEVQDLIRYLRTSSQVDLPK